MLDDHRVISNKYLIKPKAYDKAKEVLLEHGHLILTGIPGSGKTFMAKSLIQEVVTSDANYKPIKISTAAEWKELVDTEAKQVVFVDDFLGKYRVCENDICEWRSLADLIVANIKAKHTLLVLTIRHFSLKSVASPTIVTHNSTDQLFSLLDESVTIDLSSKSYTMTHEEKQIMLEHYLLVDKMDLDRNKVDGICKIKRALGFPQVCKIMTTCKEKVHTEEAYSDPDQLVLSELHRIDKENKPLIAALVLTMLNGGKNSLQNLNNNVQKTDSILTYFGLSVQDLGEIGKCLESACGTYLTLSEGETFIFNHDTQHADVLKFFLSKNRQLTLECCSLQLLCTLCTMTSTVTKTRNIDDVWNDILVSVDDINLIQKRFKMALTTGNAGDFTNIAEAKIWKEDEFREFVYSNCSFFDLSKNLFVSVDENKKTLFAHFCCAGRLKIVMELTYRLERASPSIVFKDQISYALEESVKHAKFEVVNFLLSRDTKVTDEAMLACARKENVDIMKLLLQHGGNIKSKRENGESLLHEACVYSKLTMCTYLIEQNRDLLFDKDKDGVNPVYIAAMRGNLPLLKHLLSCDGDPWSKTVNGQTILHAACVGGNIEMVKHILSSYPDLLHVKDINGLSVLHITAFGGHMNVLEHLVSCSVDPVCKIVDGQTILHTACLGGNIEMVKHIITAYPDMLHVKNYNGWSVLYTAALKGHINVLEHLLGCGVNPLCKTVAGNTILHAASEGGNIEMIKHIISSYPDMLHVKNNNGWSVLHTPVFNGHINVLEHLLGCGVDPMCKPVDGQTILNIACQGGNIEMVKHIISYYPDMLHVKDNFGMSALYIAVRAGHINVLEYLLGCGVDPMCKNVDGQTILHAACHGGSIEVVKHIISSYPEMLHVRDNKGGFVLHITAHDGHMNVLEYLVSCGVDPMCKTVDGQTILHAACQGGNKEMVKHIISSYPDMLHVKNNDGWSVLHTAALKGHIDVLEHLLGCGVKPMCKTVNGQTILHAACRNGNMEMVKHIISSYPDMLHVKNNDEWSVLHTAARDGYINVLKHLLGCGVNPMCRTIDGQTILHTACRGGNIEMIKHIISSYPDMLHIKMNNGLSVLHTTTRDGHTSVLEHLLGCNVDPRCKTVDGHTILHTACEGGNIEMVKHIISSYPDLLHVKNNIGWSALYVAARDGHINVLEHLLGCGVDPMCRTVDGQTILHVACRGGNIEMVKHIISSYPDMLHVRENSGCSVLHITACYGQMNVLEHLVSCGVDPMCRTVDGQIILHAACEGANLEMVKYITSSYPDMLHVKNNKGWSVLHTAARNGHINVLEHLLGCGVNPMCRTDNGQTILHAACAGGNIEMVKHIITSYPDRLHVKFNNGWSVLHTAALKGHINVLKHLLCFDVDPLCKTAGGHTILHVACQGGNIEMVKYIISSYPDMLHVLDGDGWSVTHHTVLSDNTHILQYLVGKGLDLACRTNAGQRLVDISNQYKKHVIMEFLLQQ